MPRAATEIMQDILFAAVVDAIGALKTASKGVPNTMMRDIQALHPNTTFADLPKELQTALGISVRAAFTKLLKEGYSVAPTSTVPQRPASPIPNRGFERSRPGDPRGRPPRNDRPRGDRPGGARPGGRPGGKPGGEKPGGSKPGGGKPSGG